MARAHPTNTTPQIIPGQGGLTGETVLGAPITSTVGWHKLNQAFHYTLFNEGQHIRDIARRLNSLTASRAHGRKRAHK